MDKVMKTQISGSVFDDPLASGDAKFKEGRVPIPGQRAVLGDGREYVCITTEVNGVAGAVYAQATALDTPIDNLCTAAAIGATSVTISLAGVQLFGGTAGVLAVNRLEDGYLVVNDDAGEGYCYKIKANTVSTAVTLTTTLTLHEGLKVALTVASDVFIIGPRYRKCVAGTATLPPVGVGVVASTAATDGEEQYLWVQTKGVASVLSVTGTGIAIGVPIICDASAGVKVGANAASDLVIGISMGTDTTAGATIPALLNMAG